MYVLVFVLVTFVGMMVVAGLAVDGSGQVRAKEQACATADDAARAGGQQIAGGQVVAGSGMALYDDAATQAAASWVAGVRGGAVDRWTGSAWVDGDTVKVTVSGTYKTIFLGIIGIDRLSVSCTGSASPVRVFDGEAS